MDKRLSSLPGFSFIINMKIAEVFGVKTSIAIGALVSLQDDLAQLNELNQDGSFFCTVKELFNLTTLTKYQQLESIKILEKENFLKVRKTGIPPKRCFYINDEVITEWLHRNIQSDIL